MHFITHAMTVPSESTRRRSTKVTHRLASTIATSLERGTCVERRARRKNETKRQKVKIKFLNFAQNIARNKKLLDKNQHLQRLG